MDKYKVMINPKAIRELDNIYEYIANEKLASENANGQVDRIKKAVLSLDTFPQSHQERNESRYAEKSYRPPNDRVNHLVLFSISSSCPIYSVLFNAIKSVLSEFPFVYCSI